MNGLAFDSRICFDLCPCSPGKPLYCWNKIPSRNRRLGAEFFSPPRSLREPTARIIRTVERRRFAAHLLANFISDKIWRRAFRQNALFSGFFVQLNPSTPASSVAASLAAIFAPVTVGRLSFCGEYSGAVCPVAGDNSPAAGFQLD